MSLRTKEPKTAKETYRDTAAAVEELWRRFRQDAATGPVRLTGKQVKGLAGQYYRQLVADREEDPGCPEGRDLGADALEDLSSAGQERQHSEAADKLLIGAGLVTDTESRKHLLRAMNQAAVEAGWLLHKRARGDYSPDPNASRFPELTPSKSPFQDVTLSELTSGGRQTSCLKTGENALTRARGVSGKVGERVWKGAGIEDRRLQPNHAWRRRFRTEARRLGIRRGEVDAIQGA